MPPRSSPVTARWSTVLQLFAESPTWKLAPGMTPPTQRPRAQRAPVAQTRPHMPQCAASVWGLAHALPHTTVGAAQTRVHTPATHDCPVAQVRPQPPQCAALVWVLRQGPAPHSLRGAAQRGPESTREVPTSSGPTTSNTAPRSSLPTGTSIKLPISGGSIDPTSSAMPLSVAMTAASGSLASLSKVSTTRAVSFTTTTSSASFASTASSPWASSVASATEPVSMGASATAESSPPVTTMLTKGRTVACARVAGSQRPPPPQRSSSAQVTPTHAEASSIGTSSVRPRVKRTTARCATAAVIEVHPLGSPQPSASIHTGVPSSLSAAIRPT